MRHNSDDNSGLDLYSHIEHPCLSGRTYYIWVDEFWGDSGYYSIMVSKNGGGSSIAIPPPDKGEPDDYSFEATVISLDTVYDRDLSIGDMDCFELTIP